MNQVLPLAPEATRFRDICDACDLNRGKIFLPYSRATQTKSHTKIWSSENPYEIVESNNRNDGKVMIFVTSVVGKAPIVHSFVDENGKNVTVIGTCYLDLNEVL